MGTFWEHTNKKKRVKYLIYKYLALFLVPRPGVEPGWILLHWCLRPARLPIPPSGHSVELRCKGKKYILKFQIFIGVLEYSKILLTSSFFLLFNI